MTFFYGTTLHKQTLAPPRAWSTVMNQIGKMQMMHLPHLVHDLVEILFPATSSRAWSTAVNQIGKIQDLQLTHLIHGGGPCFLQPLPGPGPPPWAVWRWGSAGTCVHCLGAVHRPSYYCNIILSPRAWSTAVNQMGKMQDLQAKKEGARPKQQGPPGMGKDEEEEEEDDDDDEATGTQPSSGKKSQQSSAGQQLPGGLPSGLPGMGGGGAGGGADPNRAPTSGWLGGGGSADPNRAPTSGWLGSSPSPLAGPGLGGGPFGGPVEPVCGLGTGGCSPSPPTTQKQK